MMLLQSNAWRGIQTPIPYMRTHETTAFEVIVFSHRHRGITNSIAQERARA